MYFRLRASLAAMFIGLRRPQDWSALIESAAHGGFFLW